MKKKMESLVALIIIKWVLIAVVLSIIVTIVLPYILVGMIFAALWLDLVIKAVMKGNF